MNYDFYDDMSMLNSYIPNNKLNLFDPYEGYLKGNAFKDEYVPYKNYRVIKPIINSEKEEMFTNISEYSFMAHDLNLYLDVFPNNKEALDKFNEYRNKANELIIKYERKYGPLAINSDIKTSIPFDWVNNWPWVN